MLAFLQSPPMQMYLNISGGYWTKVYQICSRSNFFMDDVNATIHFPIRPPVVEWKGRH